jgi:hypothetical protein
MGQHIEKSALCASELTWRKSSFSGDKDGNCVEAATVTGSVLVRDSKDRAGMVLTFPRHGWHAFLDDL